MGDTKNDNPSDGKVIAPAHFTAAADAAAVLYPAKPALSEDKLLDWMQHPTVNYIFKTQKSDEQTTLNYIFNIFTLHTPKIADDKAGTDDLSGLSLDRSNGREAYGYRHVVGTGNTGMAVVAMAVGVERGWLKRDEFVKRVDKIVGFLEHADKYDGLFSHWYDGKTGKTFVFRNKDQKDIANIGGDPVETSYLIGGLLSAKQYLEAAPNDNAEEKELCKKIQKLADNVNWNSHVDKGILYWHRIPNPDKKSTDKWKFDLPIEGWNECLITYVLAAGSKTHPISPDVYHKNWPNGKDFRNTDKPYNGIPLPLGPKLGGPAFISQYFSMFICPWKLKDHYLEDYWQQVTAHALTNRAHCIENPGKHKGYGKNCWGTSACDTKDIYTDCSPTNDRGIITPTAALGFMPFTPKESMAVLRELYTKYPEQMDEQSGFPDSFKPDGSWFSNTRVGINQAPIVVMIENYRTGKPWKWGMAPEIQDGLTRLGFDGPYMHMDKSLLVSGIGPKPAEVIAKADEILNGQKSKIIADKHEIPVVLPLVPTATPVQPTGLKLTPLGSQKR